MWSTCEKEEAENHDAGVSEVEEGGGSSLDVQLGEEVVHAVHGQVESGEPAGQEAPPPPVVVLQNQVYGSNFPGRCWNTYFVPADCLPVLSGHAAK